MARFRELKGEYVPIGITSILFGCRGCGQPVPINGLVDETRCPHCQADVTVPQRLWNHALRGVDAATLVAADGQGILAANPEFKEGTSDRRLRVERTVMDAPVCIHCQEALTVPASSWSQERFQVTCGGCGKTTSFVPPALGLGLPSVQVSHVAAPEHEPRPDDAVDAAADGDETAPIVMSCPQCSASLTITADCQRTTQCTYCKASVYLPDDLWRQLHPVRSATPWNAVFHLTPEALRRGGIQNVGCTALLILLFGGGMFVGLGAGAVAAASEGQWFPAILMGLIEACLVAVSLYIVGRSLASALAYRRLAGRLERSSSESGKA